MNREEIRHEIERQLKCKAEITCLGNPYVVFKGHDLIELLDALDELYEAANLEPIREQWNEDRCDNRDYADFVAAGQKLKDALARIEAMRSGT